MCLAVVGKVLELEGQDALVDVQGNRINAVIALVPEVKISDHVLLHAGFAIAVISKEEYDQQQRLFKEIDEYARKALAT